MASVLPNTRSQKLIARKLVYVLFLLLLSAVLLFCLLYIFFSYTALKDWYFSLNSCFYRSAYWTASFFTPAVKKHGNAFACVGIFISVAGMMYLVMRLRKERTVPVRAYISMQPSEGWWYVALLLLGAVLWYNGARSLSPAYDEVFSAVNCASLPSFQVLSYYMLPNNHIYFNFLNGVLFRWASDYVLTGRILSLIAYVGVLFCCFRWFVKVLRRHVWAFVAVLPVALQFNTWGFSFQARGYEWQLLSGWLAFRSLFVYRHSKDERALRVNTFFCILGFGIMPTFLWYYAAQLLFMATAQVYEKQRDLKFWKYQLFSAAGIFICYLPGLCFSGLHAFKDNKYVSVSHQSLAAYLPGSYQVFKYYMDLYFSSISGPGGIFTFPAFLSPVILLFSKQKERRLYGLFYVILWGVFILYALYAKRIPFARNLIFHYSITLALAIYTAYACIEWLVQRLKAPVFKAVLFAAPVLLYSIYLYAADNKNIVNSLYGVYVNDLYVLNESNIKKIPSGSTIAFSDESFYWYYICSKLHYQVSRCRSGQETYYIKRESEPLLLSVAAHYTLLATLADDYQIYKRK